MPYVSLELEVRPLAAAGLIFHLGQTQATPYMQLQVLTEQVSSAWCWVTPSLCLWWAEPNCPPPQVLLRANDGAREFSTWVTYPKLCDGQWHRVAGEGTLFLFCREGWVVEGTLQVGWLGDTNLLHSHQGQEHSPAGGRHTQQPHRRPFARGLG